MIGFFTYVLLATSPFFASVTQSVSREVPQLLVEPTMRRFRRELYLGSPIISARNTGAGTNGNECQNNLFDAFRNLKPDNFAATSIPADLMHKLLRSFSKSCLQKPTRIEELEEYTRVVKMELFTLTSGNHLVLPFVDETTERILYDKMIAFSTDWYNISRAEERNDQLMQELRAGRDRYLSLGRKMSVHEFKNLLVNSRGGIFQHPVPSSSSVQSATSKKVFFPLFSLFTEDLVLNHATLAEWLNNFHIRKYLIHEEVLSRSSKSTFSYSHDPELGAILELAKTRLEISLIYLRILNDFSTIFQATGFPSMLMDPFKEALLNDIKTLDPKLLDFIKEKKRQFEESGGP